MKKTLVYDIPTRLFHWFYAFLFVSAFFIAKTFEDDSVQYPFHMMMGITMCFMVLLRIIWGILGSKYAKFNSFLFHPKHLFEYFKGILTGKGLRHLGHNPASGWAAIVMMTLTLGLGTTGYLMVNGTNKEFFEDFHELFANAFVIVVIGHVLGILLHTLRHKELIGLSMVIGNKNSIPGEEGIQKPHYLVGMILIILVGLFVFNIKRNYNPETRALNLFGTVLQLGESEVSEAADANEASDTSESNDTQ